MTSGISLKISIVPINMTNDEDQLQNIPEHCFPTVIKNFDEDKDWKYLDGHFLKIKKGAFKLSKNRQNKVCIENTSYTGIIQLENTRIHFEPKVDTHFFYMLNFLKRPEKEFLFDPNTPIEIEEKGVNFFDFIGRLFLNELKDIIKKGLLKKYIRVHENIGYLKGKLFIKDQIQNDIKGIPKFSCIYDDLTIDNFENRIVLRALSFLIPMISKFNKELINDLMRHKYILRDFVQLINISPNDCDKIHFNRLNSHYSTIILLSKLILEENFIRSVSKGKSRCYNFIVDMDIVYEDFITKMIEDVVGEYFREYDVKSQYSYKGLVKEEKIIVIPDIVLEQKDTKLCPLVIDAKYKKADRNADYFQNTAYGLAVHGAKACCLIYPKEDVKDDTFTLSKLEEIKLYTYTIDLYYEKNLEYEDFIGKIKNRITEIISTCLKKKLEISQVYQIIDNRTKAPIGDSIVKIVAISYLENVAEEEKKIIKDYMIGKTLNKTYLTINGAGGSVINIKTDYNSRLPEHTKVIVMDISQDVWKKKIGEIHNYSEILKVSDIPKLHTKDYRLRSKLGNCYIGNNYIGTKVIVDKNIAEHPIVLVDYELKWKTEKIPSLEDIPLLSESEMINHPDIANGNVEKEMKEKDVVQEEKQEHNIKDWTGIPIKSFQLRSLVTGEWEKEYSCYNFNEMLPKLCKVLIDRHQNFDIDKLNEQLDKMYFFNERGKGWNSKQIEGTNIFIETNFDNNKKVNICRRIIKLFGYSNNDLKINLY